jgi:hypothetical protein
MLMLDYRQRGRRLKDIFHKEEQQFSARYQEHGNSELDADM